MGIEDNKLLRQLYPDRYKSKELEAILPDSPQQVRPVVTQSDVLNGHITRYFVRPVNDNMLIYEVDNKQYERFKESPRFITAQLKWKIVGLKETTFSPYGARIVGVKDFNMKSVANADLTFGTLAYYITDYLEYWQTNSATALRTETSPPPQISVTPMPSTVPFPSPFVQPAPTPSATPVIRNIASAVGYASPTFAEGTTSAVALVTVNPIEGQFYVGSSVEFSYEVFILEYEFVSWATVRMQSNIDSTGIETFEEVDTVISTEPTLTLTIPPEGIKIKANFRRS
jgi:hypothetical protein